MAVKDPKTPFAKSGDEIYKDEKPSPFSIEALRSGATSSKIVKGFLILSGLIMAGGFVIGAINPPGGGNASIASNPRAAVATVGDQTIQNAQLLAALEQQLQFKQYTGQTASARSFFDDKKAALDQLAGQAAVVEAAKKAGITASDAEIDKKMEEFVAERLKPQPGQSEAALRRSLEAQFGSVAAAKTELLKSFDRDLVANQVLSEKLEKQVKDANKTTEESYKAANTRLKLWQIVVRPEAPKSGSAPDDAAKTAAQSEAAKVFAELKKNPTLANFQATARRVSDDEGTKKSGGDVGAKLPAEVFGDPTWPDLLARSNGNLVGPLKDAAGAQTIFFVESRKLELPKDYAKNKKSLLEAFEKQKDDDAWRKKQDEFKVALVPEVSDPALSAYNLVNDPQFFSKTTDEQKRIREEALAKFQSAGNGSSELEAAAIALQRANLHRDLGQKKEQLEALKAATENAPRDVELRLDYARVLRDGGQLKEATEQVKAASQNLTDNPPQPSMFGGPDPSAAQRQQIAAEFELLKQPKLAQQERAKIPPAPQGGMGGFPGGVQIQ